MATRDDSGIFETEKFLEFCKTQVTKIGLLFTEPDDDWYPIFIVDGKRGFGLLPVDMPEEGTREKEALFEILPELLGMMRPTRIAFIASGWTLPTPERAKEFYEKGGGPIANEPDRIEMVFIHVGDGTHQFLLRSEIGRDGVNPPTIKEWRRESFDVSLGGRIPELIEEVLR